jgi:hypothetical protein
MNDVIGVTIGVFGLIILGVAVLPIVYALLGGIGGWATGLFFGDTILAFLASLGIEGLSMWQIGASLGFISAFFKTTVTTTNLGFISAFFKTTVTTTK